MLKGVHEPATQLSSKDEQVLNFKFSVDNLRVILKLSTSLSIDNRFLFLQEPLNAHFGNKADHAKGEA